MAGRPRKGKGRKRVRTAAQRAALKKAQAASARKRRRRNARRVAGTGAKVAGSFAGAALSYHIANYGRHPSKVRKDVKQLKSFIKKKRSRPRHNLGIPTVPPRRNTTIHGGYKGVIL